MPYIDPNDTTTASPPQGGLLNSGLGGLLANTSSFLATPAGQGLLATGLGYLSVAGRKGYGSWNTLGAAGTAGLQGYAAAERQQRETAMDAQRLKLYDAQLKGANLQNQSQQMDFDQKSERRNYWATRGAPADSPQFGFGDGQPFLSGASNLPPFSAMPAAAGLPYSRRTMGGLSIGDTMRPAGMPTLSRQPDVSPQDLLRMGYSVEDAKNLARVGDWSKASVRSYHEVRNPDGSVNIVGFDEFGQPVNTGATPFKAPEVRDFGGYVGAVDQITGKTTKLGDKTVSPDTAAQVGVARERLRYDQSQPKGVIVQTDQGTMLVDQRTGRAIPATGPDGAPLSPKLRDIPPAANTAIATNNQNLTKIQTALDLLDGKEVGQLKGDKNATGWKGYGPQSLLNRWDDKGVDTRAMIGDIGSLIIHDRSGSAVTAAESPRLMPFIPLITDDRDTARKKLVRFKQLYELEQQGLQDTYSRDQGYRAPPPKSARPPLDSFSTNQGGNRPALTSFER